QDVNINMRRFRIFGSGEILLYLSKWNSTDTRLFIYKCYEWLPIPVHEIKMKYQHSSYDCSAICDEYLFLFGYDQEDSHAYHLPSKSWSILPHMNETRIGCCAVCYNNKIYLFGGFKHDKVVTSCECYDIARK